MLPVPPASPAAGVLSFFDLSAKGSGATQGEHLAFERKVGKSGNSASLQRVCGTACFDVMWSAEEAPPLIPVWLFP